MDTFLDEMVAEIGRAAGPLGALILLHVSKQFHAIIRKFKAKVSNFRLAPFHAAEINSLQLITYLFDANYDIQERQILDFARHNNIPALEYLYDNGVKMGRDLVIEGILHCHTRVLDFARAHRLAFDMPNYSPKYICGDFTSIKLWFDQHADIEFDLNEFSRDACAQGNVELFKLVNSANDKNYCDRAISFGRIEMVRHLFSIGYGSNEICGLDYDFNECYDDTDWRESVIACVKIVLEHYPITATVGVESIIAEVGDFKFLEECISAGGVFPTFVPDLVSARMCKYLYEHGSLLHKDTLRQAIFRNDEKLVEYYISVGGPVTNGMLKYVLSRDFNIVKLVYDAAPRPINSIDYFGIVSSMSDTKKKIEYLHNICPDGNLIEIICRYDLGDLLEWAISRGHKITASVYEELENNAGIEILKYFYDNDADELDHDVIFINAIKSGKLEILNLIHGYRKMDAIYGSPMYEMAAKCNKLNVVKWLHARGYKWDDTILNGAIFADSAQIVKYLIECNYVMPAREILREMVVDKPRVSKLLAANKLI